jgi:hypothetical protein
MKVCRFSRRLIFQISSFVCGYLSLTILSVEVVMVKNRLGYIGTSPPPPPALLNPDDGDSMLSRSYATTYNHSVSRNGNLPETENAHVPL